MEEKESQKYRDKEKSVTIPVVNWNPWHGCHRCSKGCLHCYVFEQDLHFGIRADEIKLNRSNLNLPIRKVNQRGKDKDTLDYKVPSGSIVITCDTSDFFLREADIWRQQAWKYIKQRRDCLFVISTKRVQRIEQCLPIDWLDGYSNVQISVSVEDEETALERIPKFLGIDAKHKQIEISPMLERMDIRPFLSSGYIESVIVSGETYNGLLGESRVLDYSWVEDIKNQCDEYDVAFEFFKTGTKLRLKNNKVIKIKPFDESGLAEFYKLDTSNELYDNWLSNVEDFEERERAETAYKLYLKILESMKD